MANTQHSNTEKSRRTRDPGRSIPIDRRECTSLDERILARFMQPG